jgi:cyclase
VFQQSGSVHQDVILKNTWQYQILERDFMKVQRVGKRGIVFTFFELDNYPTNVFVSEGLNHMFVCDTFLGPVSMEEIKTYIRYHFEEIPYIIFNSHSHWDHIWGNCAFESLIISHDLCRKTIAREGKLELEQYEEYAQGNVKIVLPTVTFKKSILFPDDDIKFFYTPGHTRDSASCLDYTDNILFVGDNVEAPIPYLFYDDLREYTHTLQEYLDLRANVIVPGHGTIPDESLIRENLDYVEAFIQNDTEKYEKGKYQCIHQTNLKIQKK